MCAASQRSVSTRRTPIPGFILECTGGFPKAASGRMRPPLRGPRSLHKHVAPDAFVRGNSTPTNGSRHSGCRVNSQHLDELSDLAQVTQRVARGLVVAPQEVHIENVLPGPPAHGPRLD